MSCPGLLDGLRANIDSILGVRDSIGATFKTVSILTRTWSGTRVGDGSARDSVVLVSPTPQVTEYGNDVRIQEGGAVKQGDNLVKGISKQSYPLESDIDGSSTDPLVEKFYLLDDKVYTVINVKEKYLTWDVLLRERSDQTRY